MPTLRCYSSCTAMLLLATAAAAQQPATVLVVYHSEQGHTRAMAQAVADGAGAVPGTRVRLLPVAEASNADVLATDAIIVGSPVYNAAVAPQVQRFINGWPFEGSPLKDRIGAAFVSAGAISAGEELVQLGILHSMLVFGMIIVGGPAAEGAFGASAVTIEPPFGRPDAAGHVDPYFLDKGRALGRRVAELAVRLKRAPPEDGPGRSGS